MDDRRIPVVGKRKGLWVFVALCCGMAGGCMKSQPFVTAERKLRGLVIVLPGIEGRGTLNEAICKGLNKGGVNWSIELYDWTTGVPGNYLYHLRAQQRNRGEAALLAQRIRLYHTRYPGRPVVIVGQSGGAAIAVWVAEAMHSARSLTGVVMLAPALSPGYDLRPALGNTERGLVNLYSRRDWVLLGMGTSMWGTMDGKHSSSAGRLSFAGPAAAPAGSPYARLFELSWNREMSDVGYAGGHLSSGAEAFVARYVAPLVLAKKWDKDLMVRVLTQDWTVTPRLPPPEQWRVEPVPQNGATGKKAPRAQPASRPKSGRRRGKRPIARRAIATKRRQPAPATARPAPKAKRKHVPTRPTRPMPRAMYVLAGKPVLVRDEPLPPAPRAANGPEWNRLAEAAEQPAKPAKPAEKTGQTVPVPRWKWLAEGG